MSAAAADSPALAADVALTIDNRQARLMALLDAEVAALTAARSGAIPYSVLVPLTARTLDAIVDDGMPLLAEYAALDDRAARLAARLASAAADGDAAVGSGSKCLLRPRSASRKRGPRWTCSACASRRCGGSWPRRGRRRRRGRVGVDGAVPTAGVGRVGSAVGRVGSGGTVGPVRGTGYVGTDGTGRYRRYGGPSVRTGKKTGKT
eukprot:TRINITY_DN9719_c0_g1_i1.p2 TRINITY_DN9719_c0_g1~~TRINITY_DN9719_c0_g1_i1.p2  ORF type:complete len:206 (+),score=38.72 TRINITY_DN9719_c0_g1_i1:276-893(+)